MKKFVSIVMALCLALSLVSFAQAADYSLAIKDNVAVMVGNTNAIAQNSIITLPIAPVIENDRMLVPVRFVASAFGADVTWDESKRLVTLKFGNERVVEMVIGNKNISVNGQVYESDVAPVIRDGYTMLPVNFLATVALGKNVFYDDTTKMAVVSNRKTLSNRDTDVINQIAGAITSGVLPEIVVKAPIEQGSVSGEPGAETGKLAIVSVTADQEPEPDNGGAQMIDGSTGTRWASQGSASATVDLGAVKPVTHIRVAVWRPTERNTNYSIEVSATGSKWNMIFDGASSGATWDKYDVNDKIRYVRINPNGTSAGDWASILELEVWNGEASVSGGTSGGTITPVSVSADQTPEPENVAENVFDGVTDTKWACQGTGTLTADLGSAKQVSSIELNFWKFNERTTNYTLSVSADGVSYQEIFSGSSSLGAEYDVRPVNQTIRYIKFTGTGTSQGDWTSLNEMVIKGGGSSAGTVTTPVVSGGGAEIASPTGTKASIAATSITVSQEPEADNNKANLVDGIKQTVWASQNDADAVIDLGSAKTVSCVGVAMKMYEDARTIPYDISVSTDGSNYTQVWSGESEPSTDATKYVSVDKSARYVKITAHGNTVSGWNSVAEIEIYTK